MIVIKIVGLIGGEATEHDGRFVSRYDPTVHAADGSYQGGILETTLNPLEALQFQDAVEALETWKRTPGCQCHNTRRQDGRPNRPLTAYTVEVVESGSNRLKGDAKQ